MSTENPTTQPIPGAEPPQVAPDEVQAFLRGPIPAPGNAPTKLDLDAGAQADLGLNKPPGAPPAAPAPIHVPADPAVTSVVPTQDNAALWHLTSPELGKVTVSDLEKALYLKAALNDVPLELPIPLPVGDGIEVVVRSRTNYETDTLFSALREDEAAALVKDPADFGTRLHHYCCALQVLKVNGTPISPCQLQGSDMKADGDLLRNYVKQCVEPLNSARYSIMMTAVRIFTVKENICSTNLANRNFWKPADNG